MNQLHGYRKALMKMKGDDRSGVVEHIVLVIRCRQCDHVADYTVPKGGLEETPDRCYECSCTTGSTLRMKFTCKGCGRNSETTITSPWVEWP